MEKIEMRIYTCAAITLFALLAASALAAEDSISVKDGEDILLRTMQVVADANETSDGQSEMLIWNGFVENFDYEGEILNKTLQGNMTSEEAMTATAALLTLNSFGLTEAEKVKPSESYADFYNYSINAMKYFNVYLYNMAKIFETGDARYTQEARDAFNITMDYYTQGKDEADFLYD